MITAPLSVVARKNGDLSYSGSPAFMDATAARFSTRLVDAVFSRPLRLRKLRSGARPATWSPSDGSRSGPADQPVERRREGAHISARSRPPAMLTPRLRSQALQIGKWVCWPITLRED